MSVSIATYNRASLVLYRSKLAGSDVSELNESRLRVVDGESRSACVGIVQSMQLRRLVQQTDWKGRNAVVLEVTAR